MRNYLGLCPVVPYAVEIGLPSTSSLCNLNRVTQNRVLIVLKSQTQKLTHLNASLTCTVLIAGELRQGQRPNTALMHSKRIITYLRRRHLAYTKKTFLICHETIKYNETYDKRLQV